ncbi:MAG: glycosyltransferase [Salibacteraceae bacterium]
MSAVNLFSFHFLPKKINSSFNKKVSILIPVRNEEDNIINLLTQLKSFSYSNFEVIIYNDNSDDSTREVVETFILKEDRFTLINGQALPIGWLGKNHACHHLSLKAKGDFLLFLDADVKVKDGLLERALQHITKHHLDLLSIFPKQQFGSIGEKISVPLMNWILLTLLPLILIRKHKLPAFSAANGQFMMFNSEVYNRVLPHKLFKKNAVEDIAIIREFKNQKLKCDTLLGSEYIQCRMYSGIGESINGFSKNIVQFFGNNLLLTIAFGIITSLAPIVVFYEIGLIWGLIYLAGIMFIRFLVSLASKQSVVQNVLLLPLQQMVFMAIIVRRIVGKTKNNIEWKGRKIA